MFCVLIWVVVWASLVAQMVKNLPTMQEIGLQFLGQEDPLEKGMAIHSSILAWRESHGQRSLEGYIHRFAKSQTRLSIFHSLTVTGGA